MPKLNFEEQEIRYESFYSITSFVTASAGTALSCYSPMFG